MADTPNGETVTPGDSQTTVQTPATTPVVNASDPAEVERLRKEKEQADLRIRQLENQAAAREKADAETQAKKLEEDQKFKELWEQERQEKETLIREREEAQRKTELEAATSNLFKDYSPAVQELARTAGLALSDDSDTAQADLKAKLDTFASKIGSPKVGPNNPGPTPAPSTDRDRAVEVMRMNNIPNQARQAATRSAVSGLSAIKEMRAANGIPEAQ
jgi:small-conductance mechanosensitive channel